MGSEPRRVRGPGKGRRGGTIRNRRSVTREREEEGERSEIGVPGIFFIVFLCGWGEGASEPSVFVFLVFALNVFFLFFFVCGVAVGVGVLLPRWAHALDFSHLVRHRPCGCCFETQLGVHRMVLSGRDERRSRRLDKHQLGLSSSSSGSVFPGRNHSSGSLVGRPRRHAGRRGAVLSDTGLPAPHRSGRAVAAGSQPQSLSGAPLCGGASLMVARHTAQGPRCPGGRRQAEVDTVYCEVCGGRAPQVSGELMDLSEDDPWDQRCVCACGGSPGQTKRRCSQQPSRTSEFRRTSIFRRGEYGAP